MARRLLLAAVLGALLMAPAWWLGRHPGRIPSFTAAPRRAAAPLNVQYPVGWRVEHDQGRRESYQQVRLIGPRNAEDTYTAFIAIRVRPRQEEGGWYERIEDLMRQTMDHTVEGSTVDGPRAAQVAGLPAEELVVSSTLTLRPEHGLRPGPIPVKSRAVFFARERAFYEVVFSADAREYAPLEPEFDEMLRSFVIGSSEPS